MASEFLPGRIALFGSGETSLAGGRVFETLAHDSALPLRIAVLETPAGFEPNSAKVAGRVAEFMRLRLQNYQPQIDLVPARKKGTPFSPDNPGIIEPLLHANLIFLGPGSPTYTVRQLADSLAWHTLLARHRLGAAIVLASAATIAASASALPVYEIYKVGADLHWHAGLNLLGAYGLALAFVPHWNNTDGGADLDTSRCFMGQQRFEQLVDLLPPHVTVVGIDEYTALVFDLPAATCQVMGAGGVSVLHAGQEKRFDSGATFSLSTLGQFQCPNAQVGIPASVWENVRQANCPVTQSPDIPSEIAALVEEREAARTRRAWVAADDLRARIKRLGWEISDTPHGPRVARTGEIE